MISRNTTLEEGETVLLACVGYSEPYVNVTWMINGAPVNVSSPRISTWQETIGEDRPYQISFLRFCSAEMADAGAYTCVASNRQTAVNRTVQLTVMG